MDPTEDTTVVPEVPDAPVEDPTSAPPEDTGNDEPEVTAADPDSNDDDGDPAEVYYQARKQQDLDFDRERLRREVRAEIEAEMARQRDQALSAQQQEQLRDSFTEAVRESYRTFKSIKVYNEDGQEMQLPDDVFEQLVGRPFQRHNSVVQRTVSDQVLLNLGQTALQIVAEDRREDFIKAANGKPLDQYLMELGEAYAPRSRYVENLRKEFETEKKAEYYRGFSKGQKSPTGTARNVNERQRSGEIDRSTISGAARALANGDITDEEYRAIYRKLRG